MESAKVTLRGAIGAPPEIRYRQDGKAVALFPVITSRWRMRAGQREQVTEKHPVVIYNDDLIEAVRAFRQGDQVAISGALQLRTFTDAQRVTRTVAEVVLQPHRGKARRLEPYSPS
jgi:single stranded DNA-binding protein